MTLICVAILVVSPLAFPRDPLARSVAVVRPQTNHMGRPIAAVQHGPDAACTLDAVVSSLDLLYDNQLIVKTHLSSISEKNEGYPTEE